MSFLNLIKKQLKKYHALVLVKRKIWSLLKIGRAHHPCIVKDNYFPALFSGSPNFNSISFDEGLIRGSFKNVHYLLKIRPKNFIESCVYLDGLWESHIIELISSYLSNSAGAVIDIGANIGATSIPLAKQHSNTTFYLYEPHPLIFSDLSKNINYNKLTNIKARNIAISNASSQSLPFYAQKNTTNLGLSSFKLNHDIDDYDIIKVECASVDSLFKANDIRVHLIKIDTQGIELQVLLSAQNTIRKNKPVIIFEFESEYFKNIEEEKETKQQILDFFHSEGYELYMVTRHSSYFPKVTFDSYFHGEIIAVPTVVTSN